MEKMVICDLNKSLNKKEQMISKVQAKYWDQKGKNRYWTSSKLKTQVQR